MMTRDILDALRLRHATQANGLSRAWIYAEEVRVSTGFAPLGVRGGSGTTAIRFGGDQRIDAMALHTWPSKKYRRVAYEVKATRTDLLRELDQPEKCAAALALSNEFYLVAPTEVLIGGILDVFPETWGVISYYEGRLTTVHRAPWRETPTPPYSFMLSLARNLQASSIRVEEFV